MINVTNGAVVTIKDSDGAGLVTASGSGKHALDISGGSTVIIESGKFVSEDSWGIYVGRRTDETKGNKLIINDGTFEAREGAVVFWRDAEVVINGGEFSAEDNAVISGNGSAGLGGAKVEINGGTFNGNIENADYLACGVYMPNSGELTLNGGTFNIENGVGILIRAGEVEINEGVNITTTGAAEVKGKVGDSRILANCSAIYIDGEADYTGWHEEPSITTINGGTFKSDVKKVTISVLAPDVAQDHLVVNNGAVAETDIAYL